DLHENLAQVDVADVMRSIAEGHNRNSTKVHLPISEIAPLMGKPLALKRCLSNIIDNGVKYGHEVWVLAEDTAESLVIRVQDRGPGIPEDKMDSVYEPYVRLATDDEGHGLGMGITRNILHAHGGEMSIRNMEQGGLEVTMILPRLMD